MNIMEQASFTFLPDGEASVESQAVSGRKSKALASILNWVFGLLLLLVLIVWNIRLEQVMMITKKDRPCLDAEARGVKEGVSFKSNRCPSRFGNGALSNMTNAMLSWQRTAFHFQPEKNWMNDPNGPLYHMGWYHLFYQYNPHSAVWGNITWGHAVSTDMIHWLYLPIAMVPDHWYDINGVWTGSATRLDDGQIIMLYTGDTNGSVQVQNLAYPANQSDPLLLAWEKYPNNPVISPPPGIKPTDFRDPTTAWIGPNATWRVAIGSEKNGTGLSFVYQTRNFTEFKLLDGVLHAVSGTGTWECVDFYPVSLNGSNGLDTSVNGLGVKHVLKASLDESKVDYYAIGTYDPATDRWTPDDPKADLGSGYRIDYGRCYASKTFYDVKKKRRILWGWINETDTESDDLQKGWASVQTIPRNVILDNKTGANLVQLPVEEIESLRENSSEFKNVLVAAGSVLPLEIGMATQLDIFVEFETKLLSEINVEETYQSGCDGGGAVERSSYGPFGVLVIADEALTELTPIFFRPTKTMDGSFETYFCSDETRSSMASDVLKQVYGSIVPVIGGEKLQMRILVDHSVVESFAQGGRTVITSRIYPTQAIYGAARLFLFNNATQVDISANLTIWEMKSAFIHPFPLEQN